MKEVTYEEWQKNPTPRMMWVWNSIENDKEQRKVFYIIFFLKIFCKNYLTLYYTRFNILNVSGKRITLPRGVNYERSNL